MPMFERKVSKGRIVLAMGVASALAACGGENTGWQPEEYEPREIEDGEPIELAPVEDVTPEVPSGPSVVGKDAESDLESVASVVAANCPGTTHTFEGTDDADTTFFDDYYFDTDLQTYIYPPFAYVLGDGNDTFSVNAYSEGYGTAAHCVVGGSGDDVIHIERASGAANSGEYFGYPTGLRIVGGLGRDTVYYGGQSYYYGSENYRPPFTFVDFDCRYDDVVVDEDGNNLVSTEVREIPYFNLYSNYDYENETYYSGYLLVVDPTDGEIWLHQNYYGEGAYNTLLGTVDGAVDASCVRVGTTPEPPAPVIVIEPPVIDEPAEF